MHVAVAFGMGGGGWGVGACGFPVTVWVMHTLLPQRVGGCCVLRTSGESDYLQPAPAYLLLPSSVIVMFLRAILMALKIA